MPRQRPAASGYARLAQADEEDRAIYAIESDDEDPLSQTAPLSATTTRYAAIQPQPRDAMRSAGPHTPSRRHNRRRPRRNSTGIDIKAINARLERWADEIASKFKISPVKGKSQEEEQLEIHHSVFQAPDGVRPYTPEQLAQQLENNSRMTKIQFDDIIESVRVAMEIGVHPKLITQGSSGSYFARNSDGKVVGVFKPKDEEPYASRNPKWTKWIHRNLFPWCFGRACLIPNLSYVSEAAAYVLDCQLQTNIVPYTDLVWLSSKSFFYDFWDRRSTWGGKKSLPAKIGSFQVFLKGFKDANVFLRDHPWPDQNTAQLRADIEAKKKRGTFANCLPTGGVSDEEDEGSRVMSPAPVDQDPHKSFRWTSNIKQSFREQLEKLVILDYIMRNTDRGLDNWMVKIDQETEQVTIVAEPPRTNSELEDPSPHPVPISVTPQRPTSNTSRPYRRYEAMASDSRTGTPLNHEDEKNILISLGAIDNSLSWPWKHPDAWRSFPFGWLFLPVSLIGQPFSQKTRDHFLPILTSTAWWSDTQMALRHVFAQDSDFKESMFARQIAVMKGQAWNVVETLKQPDHGPLELTRRMRVCVWDDLVDIPVAIPMRTPSVETARLKHAAKELRNRQQMDEQQEEMDIGVGMYDQSQSSAPPDLLLESPTSELPNPNRFELTRGDESFTGDLGRVSEDGENSNFFEPSSPVSERGNYDFVANDRTRKEAKVNLSQSLHTPSRPKHKARFSFDFSRSAVSGQHEPSPAMGGSGRRPRAMSSRSGMRNYRATETFYDDDLEGDLGYSAAQDMEGRTRKVIVERLEAVKSKNPVFTWC